MDKLLFMAEFELLLMLLITTILLIKNKKTLDIRIKLIYPMLGVLIGSQIAFIFKLV